MTSSAEVKEEFAAPLEEVETQIVDWYLDVLAAEGRPAADLNAFKGIKNTSDAAKKAVQNLLGNQRAAFRKVICDDLSYCERIESGGVKLALEIADAIVLAKIVAVTAVPFPAVRISVYFVRTRALDPLCECARAPKR